MPANLAVKPKPLKKINNKATEAADMIDNIKSCGIYMRKYEQLQTWAKDCR